MKRLHDKVNIIPLIAKADTMTPDECREFKRTVSDLYMNKKLRVSFYQINLNNSDRQHVVNGLLAFLLVSARVTYRYKNCTSISNVTTSCDIFLIS